MKNFVQSGEVIEVTVAAGSDAVDLKSGDGYLVGKLFGVAVADAAIGEGVQLQRVGVVDLPKISAQAWAVGDSIYWNTATRLANNSASGNGPVGIAVAVADNPSATGRFLLMGHDHG